MEKNNIKYLPKIHNPGSVKNFTSCKLSPSHYSKEGKFLFIKESSDRSLSSRLLGNLSDSLSPNNIKESQDNIHKLHLFDIIYFGFNWPCCIIRSTKVDASQDSLEEKQLLSDIDFPIDYYDCLKNFAICHLYELYLLYDDTITPFKINGAEFVRAEVTDNIYYAYFKIRDGNIKVLTKEELGKI